MTDLIGELETWYLGNCDGDWEHQFGVHIDTLDNPGWEVRINLEDTPLEGLPFARLKQERDEHDWVHCRVENATFVGYGGPRNLSTILRIFMEWQRSCQLPASE